MDAVLVTPPASEPITLFDAKAHLNISLTATDDDDYIETLIKVARRRVEQTTRRRLFTQTWKLFLQAWPGCGYIKLPFGQLQSVTHIKYYDTANTANTWDSDDYVVDIDQEPGRIVLDYAESWPSEVLHPKNPIEIQFVCGWADTDDIPEEIKHAMKIMVSDLYENREDVVISAGMTVKHDLHALKALLGPWKLWWTDNAIR